MKKEEPLKIIRPEYVYIHEFLKKNSITTFILILLVIPSIELQIIKIYIIIICIYILFLIISNIYNKKRYLSQTYEFYDAKLICKNNFMKEEIKEINYKNIKEVRYNQNFLDVFLKKGTICLITNSNSIFNNKIYIYNVTDFKNTYNEIVAIVNK